MTRARQRLVRALLAFVACYGLLLALGGVALRGCVEDRARDRLAASLGAEVTVGASSFSLWRGRLVLEDVTAVRDGGALELRVDEVVIDVPGWGAALLARRVDRAQARGAAMTLSALGAVDVARRERSPVRVEELVIEDATLALMPTALLPGLGRVEARVERAVAGPVELGSGLAWLRDLRELDGAVSAPGGLELGARFRAGELTLTGSLFGSRPLAIPLRLPELDPAASELEVVRAVVTEVIRAGAGRFARDAAVGAARERLERLLDR